MSDGLEQPSDMSAAATTILAIKDCSVSLIVF